MRCVVEKCVAKRSFDLGAIQKRFKPHLLMVLAQMGYTLLYFLADASFRHGMNPHVYVTYRHLLGAIVLLPFAYFLEKKTRPKLTLTLSLEIFVVSLLGVGFTPNAYFASLHYTSPTFVVSMVNTIPSLTFMIAMVLRLEDLNIKSPRGIAKIVGTLVSLVGVMIMTLYKGPILKSLRDSLIHIEGSDTYHGNWLKGSILVIASCMAWSAWYIMQAIILKKYPAELSLAAWMSSVGGVQSAVFAVIMQHKPNAWTIGLNIDLWNIIYSGVVISGLIVFIQLWCTKERGPVFVTMFNPVGTLMVAFLAYFVFGERLHAGRILGGFIVIVGLYLLLWGKEEDRTNAVSSSSSCEEQKERKQDTSASFGETGEQA